MISYKAALASLLSLFLLCNGLPSSPTSSQHDSQTSIGGTMSTAVKTAATGTATTDPCAYWLENVQHQGISPFNPDKTYKVFRNVKDFGAKGDGIADDSAAINAAISSGNRCGPSNCNSSSITPGLIYFPKGTYLVSSPIIDYYFTQLVGNPNCVPTIKVSATFTEPWVIDGDQYQPSGNQGWISTNIFWRQIRNFVIDMTAVPPSRLIRGIHWPTGQASSLQNIVFQMSSATDTQHEGIFIENGSGGFVTDLTFYGGLNGATFGNQQFTMRNLNFHNCKTAINQIWDWGWTYQGISINNCSIGLNIAAINSGAHAVGSVVLYDSCINNTGVGIFTTEGTSSSIGEVPNPSVILENVQLNNVPVAVKNVNRTILTGTNSTMTIGAWGQGNAYTPTGPRYIQDTISPNNRPSSLLSGNAYYTRTKPQYEDVSASMFLSARDLGATGDGQTDDTLYLQGAINRAAETGQILFVDAGTYIVSNTLYIPAGAKIVGESYPVIMSSGSLFGDVNNPVPVVQVGKDGESGCVELSDLIVSPRGAQAGAVLIEWNLAAPADQPSGMWDVHTRVGGTAGSELQLAQCVKTPTVNATTGGVNPKCIANFASMRITKCASGLYMENVWLWVADHDVEDPQLTQISIYAGRGLQIESSKGNIWLYGTAVEHHVLYEYQFVNTQNIVAGQIQTESAYFQPNPVAPIPFPPNPSWSDPIFNGTLQSGWGLRVVSSPRVNVYGAGLYSFFSNNNVHCSDIGNGSWCQPRIMSVEHTPGFSLYGLNTVGTTNMITVDGTDVALYSDNIDGFVDTVALFRN